MSRPGFLIGVLILFISIYTSASAEERIQIFFEEKLDRDGVPQGWRLKEKTGEAEFKILKEDGETVAFFRSVASSFSLERPLSVDPKRYPYLSWRWKVLRLPLGGDVRLKKKNDQAAQLLIAFEGRKIISYIWDTAAPEGFIHDESIGWPVNLKIRSITVKSGASDLNRWVSFRRNIVEDYQNLFTEDPPLIKGLRFQINSQNTGTVAETLFSGIVLFSALQETQLMKDIGVKDKP